MRIFLEQFHGLTCLDTAIDEELSYQLANRDKMDSLISRHKIGKAYKLAKQEVEQSCSKVRVLIEMKELLTKYKSL